MSHWVRRPHQKSGKRRKRSSTLISSARSGVKALEGISLAGAIASVSFDRAVAAATTGRAKVNEVSLSEGGISFHQQISYGVAQQTGTLCASLTKGDALFVKIELAGKRGRCANGERELRPRRSGRQERDHKVSRRQIIRRRNGWARLHRTRSPSGVCRRTAGTNITVEPNLRTALQALLVGATTKASRQAEAG
jgi:hypothetical protein